MMCVLCDVCTLCCVLHVLYVDNVSTVQRGGAPRATLPYAQSHACRVFSLNTDHGGLVAAARHPVLERWHHVHAVVQGNLGERRPHATLGARRLG